MPLASLPGLVSRAVPVRWRRHPGRRPRHVLCLEPLEDRALLATLMVPVPDVATLPAGAVTAWVRELVDGRYDSVTITSLDAEGLQRLLADLTAGGVPYQITRTSPPPPPAANSPPPPPAGPGEPPPLPDPPTLSPTPMLRGGLTLTLFRPPPTSRPDKPADSSRPADPAAEVAPIPARTGSLGTTRPAAPPERVIDGGAVGTPAAFRRPVDPGGSAVTVLC